MAFPEQWVLFDALDTSGDGALEQSELVQGLAHWGYSIDQAQDSFQKLSSQSAAGDNNNTVVTLADFCRLWPRITANPIGPEYEGILSLQLHNVTNLTSTPWRRWTSNKQLVCAIRLGDQVVNAECVRGDGKNFSTLAFDQHQSLLELKCRPPATEQLEIALLQDSQFVALNNDTVASTAFSLSSFATKQQQCVQVDLEPHGSLCFTLKYAKFVDRWDICLVENQDAVDEDNRLSTKVTENSGAGRRNNNETIRDDNNGNKMDDDGSVTKQVVVGNAIGGTIARIFPFNRRDNKKGEAKLK